MPHPQKIGHHYLTCGTDCAVAEIEGPEEIFRTVLELSDNMPEKADLLSNCRDNFLKSFLGNTNRKDDIDNCILAYESAVHPTPQDHSEMSGRLNMLGVSFYHRFERTGILADISEAILCPQKALHLTPEVMQTYPVASITLEIHFYVATNAQEIFPIFPMPYHISRERLFSLLRAMQPCPHG